MATYIIIIILFKKQRYQILLSLYYFHAVKKV